MQSTGPASRSILLLENPIHTDIAIPIDADVRRQFAFVEKDHAPIGHPEAHWLIIGWGGRAFYTETPTWSDLKPEPVFKAFTIDRSVMHVEVAAAIGNLDPAVTAIALGEDGYARLIAYMLASFRRADGEPVVIAGAAYGPNDLFYEAVGSFNAFVGCNTWTARALSGGGPEDRLVESAAVQPRNVAFAPQSRIWPFR